MGSVSGLPNMWPLAPAGKAGDPARMKRAHGVVAAVAFVVAWVAGAGGVCGPSGQEARPGAPRIVRDGAGRPVAVPPDVRRVVSLAPSITEILFAVGGGGLVVGVTDFCDHPAEAASRPRVGGLIHPDLETIASLHPDLAIATTAGNYLEDAERIERLGIPVYTVSGSTVEEIIGTLVELGSLVGRRPEAERVAAGLRERIRRLGDAAGRSEAPRPRALFVIEPEPLIVPGPGTFVGEAVRLSGADPVSHGSTSGWNQMDFEQVVALAPDLILATKAHASWARSLAGSAEWRLVPAAREGNVFVISDAIQHPGPRLVDGMEEVAAIVAEWRGRRGKHEEDGPGLTAGPHPPPPPGLDEGIVAPEGASPP
jgi:iron complex transport system substrate-binding protein